MYERFFHNIDKDRERQIIAHVSQDIITHESPTTTFQKNVTNLVHLRRDGGGGVGGKRQQIGVRLDEDPVRYAGGQEYQAAVVIVVASVQGLPGVFQDTQSSLAMILMVRVGTRVNDRGVGKLVGSQVGLPGSAIQFLHLS